MIPIIILRQKIPNISEIKQINPFINYAKQNILYVLFFIKVKISDFCAMYDYIPTKQW